jgi:hypothetical protein
MALLAFMKSQETHLAVNSRLDAFISAAEHVARMDGTEQERKRGENMAARVARQRASRTGKCPARRKGTSRRAG